MAPRLELHALLEQLAAHVYFQPPETVQMKYPCIVYHRDFAEVEHADNGPYRRTVRYMVTVIDRDPDSTIVYSVAMLPMCTMNRFFTTDGLNHDVFTLFF
jgi:hypothetical protein